MHKLFRKDFYTQQKIRSLISALIFLSLAILFQSYVSSYSTRVSGGSVPDLLLDHLPIINLNWVIVEGALAVIVGTIVLLFYKPEYLIFTLKAVAIFVITRAVFLAVTHVGVYPGQIGPDNGFFDRIYKSLDFEVGLFFSGHTGLSYLMALIFWNERFWRYVYLSLAVIFGISVLFAHIHYSIDVLAAPFITYSIYKLSQYLFKEDYRQTQP